MKRLILTLSSAILLLSPFFASAQTLTNKDKRNIYTKAISLIEIYENCASLSNDYNVYDFIDLFPSQEQKIVCDLPGTRQYMSAISVAEYIRLVSDLSVSTEMNILDVRKGELRYENGDWILPVTFKKDISYIDNNGVMFLTNTGLFPILNMTMDIRYDSDEDKCLIDFIRAESASIDSFLKNRYFVVEKSFANYVNKKGQKYLPSLTVDGKPLSFNEFDQAFLPVGTFKVSDPEAIVDTLLLKKGNNYDLVTFKIQPPKSGRLKARFGATIGGAYRLTTDNNISGKSSGYEIGVDIGNTWSVGSKARLGLYTGIGFNFSSLNLSLANPLSYDYTTIDYSEENGYYYKSVIGYNIDSAEESVSYGDLLVPLYLEMEHIIGKYVLISWNVGAKLYANLLTTPKGYHVEGKQVCMSESTPINQTFKEFISPVSYKRNPFDVSVAAALGVDVNLLKKVLYLSVNLGYEYGVTQSYSAKGNTDYFVDGRVYPVVYRNNENIAMHSMIASTSFRRQSLWVGIGIKLKL